LSFFPSCEEYNADSGKEANYMTDVTGSNSQREDFRVVGTSNLPGKLSEALATGIAKFGMDYVVPDMLEAKFLRSPYAHARIKSYSIEKAMAVPGVVDIVTWEDEDIKKFTRSSMGGSPMPFLPDVAEEENVEVGFIVVAENEDICDEALKKLEIEWERLPHIVDIKEGRDPDATVLRPHDRSGVGSFFGMGGDNPPKQGNVSFSSQIQGDVEKGFREADYIIEYDLNMPAYASASPNPHGSVAWWFDDPYLGTGNIHIEGAVWHASGGKNAVAQMYGLPPEKTVQHGLFQGGKYCDWTIRRAQQITPLLAKRAGRPVRCVNERKDTFDFMIMQRFIHMRVGFKKDGLITAFDDFSIADGGTTSTSMFGTFGDQFYSPYIGTKCLNIRQKMDIVDSSRGHMPFSSQFCPFNWDTVTMAIHIIAEKLGKDPIAIARLNLHGPDGQEDLRPVPSFDACIEAGKKMMNWNWHKNGRKKLPDGRMHGAGFRYQMSPRHAIGIDFQCVLELRNGMVRMPIQGPHAGVFSVEGVAMIVAEELGLEYEDIGIDYDPNALFLSVDGGANGLVGSGWAMKRCCQLFRQRLFEAAIDEANNPAGAGPMKKGPQNPLRGKSPGDLDLADGKIVLKSDRSAGVALNSLRSNVFATYAGMPPAPLWPARYDLMNTLYCEVAVDTETGQVEILRYGAAVDSGKVIRRTSLESQLDQVAFFSQGCQMFEDYYYDKNTGVKLNANMIEYKKPGMLDVPLQDMDLLETRAGNGVYGANGISHSMANTHLIICAIYNAIDKWVDPPATPDRVLEALGKA
jgi:CO/xanthine dehydrogenase Mo-binding subunit